MKSHLLVILTKIKPNLNNQGMSLVETLMAGGIMSVMALGASSLIISQQKQIKVIEAKLETVDAKGVLMKSFKQTMSGCALRTGSNNDLSFTGNPSEIEFQKILDGPGSEVLSRENGYKYSKNLQVESLKIISLTNPGVNSYRGDVEIKFKQKNSNVSFVPVVLPSINFTTTTTGSTKTITGCSDSTIGTASDIKGVFVEDLGGRRITGAENVWYDLTTSAGIPVQVTINSGPVNTKALVTFNWSSVRDGGGQDDDIRTRIVRNDGVEIGSVYYDIQNSRQAYSLAGIDHNLAANTVYTYKIQLMSLRDGFPHWYWVNLTFSLLSN